MRSILFIGESMQCLLPGEERHDLPGHGHWPGRPAPEQTVGAIDCRWNRPWFLGIVMMVLLCLHALGASGQESNSSQDVRDLAPVRARYGTGSNGTNSAVVTNRPAASAHAQTNAVRLDYASFRIIGERNIFNPNRSPRSARNERREARRQPRIDSFSLVGILVSEKGQFAFFDGNRSEFKKALKPADAIAGYKLVNILQNQVKLTSATHTVDLRMGMQMRREDEGEWNVTASTESYAHSPASVAAATSDTQKTTDAGTVAAAQNTTTNASDAEAPGASGGGESDILKRLMQRREQEINK